MQSPGSSLFFFHFIIFYFCVENVNGYDIARGTAAPIFKGTTSSMVLKDAMTTESKKSTTSGSGFICSRNKDEQMVHAVAHKESCLVFVTEKKTMSESRDICNGIHGTMADIDKASFEFIRIYLPCAAVKTGNSIFTDPFWVGLHRSSSVDNWIWDNGAFHRFQHNITINEPWSITKKNCVILKSRWNDWSTEYCKNKHSVICKTAKGGNKNCDHLVEKTKIFLREGSTRPVSITTTTSATSTEHEILVTDKIAGTESTPGTKEKCASPEADNKDTDSDDSYILPVIVAVLILGIFNIVALCTMFLLWRRQSKITTDKENQRLSGSERFPSREHGSRFSSRVSNSYQRQNVTLDNLHSNIVNAFVNKTSFPESKTDCGTFGTDEYSTYYSEATDDECVPLKNTLDRQEFKDKTDAKSTDDIVVISVQGHRTTNTSSTRKVDEVSTFKETDASTEHPDKAEFGEDYEETMPYEHISKKEAAVAAKQIDLNRYNVKDDKDDDDYEVLAFSEDRRDTKTNQNMDIITDNILQEIIDEPVGPPDKKPNIERTETTHAFPSNHHSNPQSGAGDMAPSSENHGKESSISSKQCFDYEEPLPTNNQSNPQSGAGDMPPSSENHDKESPKQCFDYEEPKAFDGNANADFKTAVDDEEYSRPKIRIIDFKNDISEISPVRSAEPDGVYSILYNPKPIQHDKTSASDCDHEYGPVNT